MSAQSFKRRLGKCQSHREVELLLQDWMSVQLDGEAERAALREAVCERVEQLGN